MSIEHHGSGYAPLPQSMSNTDTEDDEDENSQPIIDPSRENSEENIIRVHYTYDFNINLFATNKLILLQDATTTNESGGFYPLDETRNPIHRFKNRQSTLRCYADDMPIMVIEKNDSNDLWKNREMSPIRKFFFGISILLCFVTMFVFFYVLPCDDTVVCQSLIRPAIVWEQTLQGVGKFVLTHSKITSWLIFSSFLFLEFLGPMSIVTNAPRTVVIFLIRSQQYGKTKDKNINISTCKQIPQEGSCIISMQGNNGEQLWERPLHKLATGLDCNSITVIHSQPPDCIVVGEQGLLMGIESISGNVRWTSAVNTSPKLPIILPDINTDNVKDMLTVEVISTNVSYPIIISGTTGEVLKRYSKWENCFLIDIYSFVINQSISCMFHNTQGKSKY